MALVELIAICIMATIITVSWYLMLYQKTVEPRPHIADC